MRPGALKGYIVERHEDVWVTGRTVLLLCVSARVEGAWAIRLLGRSTPGKWQPVCIEYDIC